MYEEMTYEVILKRMLDRVPVELDKREGSLIFTALTAAAAEMQIMYIEFDTILKETFAETASRENLIRRASERGLEPSKATRAILKAVASPDTVRIEMGSRFRLGSHYYVVTDKMDDGNYQVTCETSGSVGNAQFGRLIPVATISGLQSMELIELLIPGEDEVETEVFRREYFNSFHEKSFGGNRQDYINKTNGIPGVGATKVTRAWNGGSTVKLTILDSDFNKASDLLIGTVQNSIDPLQSGEGNGLAPIDHRVTVDTAKECKIELSSKIEYDDSYTEEAVKVKITNTVKDYLRQLRSTWQSLGEQGCVIRISQLESNILSIDGIYDIGETKINGQRENLTLTKYQIPVYGGIKIDS